jgi:GNAT superfamily N-acetyltransferase
MMAQASKAPSPITVRLAREEDMADLASMVDDFVKGHPAEKHPRALDALRTAYFGSNPVAEVVVAERNGHIVAMGQWIRIYDMFWGMFAGRADWLYVRPEARGLGISAAILALICERIRASGAQFLYGQGTEHTKSLYKRSALPGPPSCDFHLGNEAFERLADLSGRPPREIVRALPEPSLNRVERRQNPTDG